MVKEDYKHLFLDCKYNTDYFVQIKKLLEKLGIGEQILCLRSLVLGYKIQETDYYDSNLLIVLIFYSIYKLLYFK